MAISEAGALRQAVATLWTNGGFEVFLRMPGLAVSGSDAEQLGLATPQFEDLPIGPAAWRKAGLDSALLLAAPAVGDLVASRGFASAESLFQAAVGIVVDGVLYGITKAEPLARGGVACAYRVSVREPAWE